MHPYPKYVTAEETDCLPFLVSLQVVWNGVQLLLGDQTGSEETRIIVCTLTTPIRESHTLMCTPANV